MEYSVSCTDLDSTELLAKRFVSAVLGSNINSKPLGAFVSMFAKVGAGKTTFVQFVCKYLGVKEKVTSPSFVILNEYKTGKLPVYHFDLYRLENEGISTIKNELEEYSESKCLTFVEWAEYSMNTVPFDRIELNIEYTGEHSRRFIFKAIGEQSSEIIKRLDS